MAAGAVAPASGSRGRDVTLGRQRATQAARYVAMQFVVYLVTLWGAASLSFLHLRLIPGEPVPGSRWVNETLGRNGSLPEQYVRYFGRVLQGDFGASFLNFPNPAIDLVLRALPWTATLLAVAVMIAWTIGMLIGALAGWQREKPWAQVLASFGIALNQVPYYFIALFLLITLAYGMAWFPTRGAYAGGLTPGLNASYVLSVVHHATLPALSIVIVGTFGWMISTRALIISELGSDYLVYAQATGLYSHTILFGYGLRNVLLPQVTALAISLGFVINGAILLEQLFLYPGIGLLFITSIRAVDVNTAQAIVLITITAVLTANLIVDLILPLIDPRVQARV